jgi:hypothetical protein
VTDYSLQRDIVCSVVHVVAVAVERLKPVVGESEGPV